MLKVTFRITNGKGRLFIQTLLPSEAKVKLVTGADLYSYGGKTYPPVRDTGPAPQCRIEISPTRQKAVDYFLHVLTAADAGVSSVEKAELRIKDKEFTVTTGEAEITFDMAEVRGRIELPGQSTKFSNEIVFEPIRPRGM